MFNECFVWNYAEFFNGCVFVWKMRSYMFVPSVYIQLTSLYFSPVLHLSTYHPILFSLRLSHPVLYIYIYTNHTICFIPHSVLSRPLPVYVQPILLLSLLALPIDPLSLWQSVEKYLHISSYYQWQITPVENFISKHKLTPVKKLCIFSDKAFVEHVLLWLWYHWNLQQSRKSKKSIRIVKSRL